MRKAGEDALKSVSWTGSRDDFGKAIIIPDKIKSLDKASSEKWAISFHTETPRVV